MPRIIEIIIISFRFTSKYNGSAFEHRLTFRCNNKLRQCISRICKEVRKENFLLKIDQVPNLAAIYRHYTTNEKKYRIYNAWIWFEWVQDAHDTLSLSDMRTGKGEVVWKKLHQYVVKLLPLPLFHCLFENRQLLL